MPTMLVEPVESSSDASRGPRYKKWTREELEALARVDAVSVERLELVEGDLIDKMGKNRPHVNVQHRIAKVLFAIFGVDRVSTESAVEVAEGDRRSSEPIADLVVTEREVETFEALPLPHEVSLLIEVSDTTLRYDLRTKAGLYARAGFIEYWVADLNLRRLIVHRQPENGGYVSVTAYAAEESLSPLAAPQAVVLVGGLFP